MTARRRRVLPWSSRRSAGPAWPRCSTASRRRTARRPHEVVVVDDRPEPGAAARCERPSWPFPLRVVRGWGRGPAAARNLGWRLDDDAVGRVPRRRRRAARRAGRAALAVDLRLCGPTRRGVAGAHPRAAARRPPPHRLGALDRGLRAGALGDRRHGLPARRAARGRRLRRALPPRLPRGRRPRPAGAAGRLAPRVGAARGAAPGAAGRPGDQRAGAARQRRRRADAPPARPPRGASLAGTGRGLFRRHAAASAGLALAGARRRSSARVAGGAASPRPRAARPTLLHVADLVRRRVAPGPARPAPRSVTMAWTSAAAPRRPRSWHRARGVVAPPRRRPVAAPRRGPCCSTATARSCTTCPYNGDPDAVDAVPGAREALDRLRADGPAARRRHQPVRRRRAACSPRSRWRPSTPRSTRGSGRSTPGRSARTRPDDGCACRKPAPGHGPRGGPPARGAARGVRRRSATSAPTSRPPGPPGRARCSCPRRSPGPRRSRPRRWWPPTSAGPSTSSSGGAVADGRSRGQGPRRPPGQRR